MSYTATLSRLTAQRRHYKNLKIAGKQIWAKRDMFGNRCFRVLANKRSYMLYMDGPKHGPFPYPGMVRKTVNGRVLFIDYYQKHSKPARSRIRAIFRGKRRTLKQIRQKALREAARQKQEEASLLTTPTALSGRLFHKFTNRRDSQQRASIVSRLTAERQHYQKLYLGFNEKVSILRHHGCRIVLVKAMKWSRYKILAAPQRAEIYGCRKGLLIRSFVVDRPARNLGYTKVYDGSFDTVKPRQKTQKRRFEILDEPAHHLARINRLSAEKRHYRFFRFRGKSVSLKHDRLLGRYFETKDYARDNRPFKRHTFRIYIPSSRLARYPHQARLIKVPVGNRFVMLDLYFQQLEQNNSKITWEELERIL